jgi:hypothetical protein
MSNELRRALEQEIAHSKDLNEKRSELLSQLLQKTEEYDQLIDKYKLSRYDVIKIHHIIIFIGLQKIHVDISLLRHIVNVFTLYLLFAFLFLLAFYLFHYCYFILFSFCLFLFVFYFSQTTLTFTAIE